VVQPAGSVVQASGEVANRVVSSLGAQPVLLVIILLNVIMCLSAGWYLLKQEEFRHAERLRFLATVERCMGPGAYAKPDPSDLRSAPPPI